MPSINSVLAVILGGGAGSRLFPLTSERSKPAVPVAGKYRLIDIPISNCINSSISRIAVLTQFNSVSLHRHITRTYNFDAFHRGWVQIWAAEQTPENKNWYQGTADAVRKQLLEIKSTRLEYVIILGGDHLYRMDYQQLARYHWENAADVTVAVQPVRATDASGFGILHQDSDGRITNFVEKPTDPAVLKSLVSLDDPERPYLGSMGIYMFNMDTLIDLIENTSYDDFGKHVIPTAIQTHRVFGYQFNGYWEDIGTIRSFYETNLRLAEANPPFEFHSKLGPIYTRARFLPGSSIKGAQMENVLLADGCRIGKARIFGSVVGLRSEIADDATIVNSILMGNDYYNEDRKRGENVIGISSNVHIEGAIVDKNVFIGEGVTIKPFPREVAEINEEYFYVREGIVIIPKGARIPAGTYIGP